MSNQLETPCFNGMTAEQFLDRVNRYGYTHIQPSTIREICQWKDSAMGSIHQLYIILKRVFDVQYIKHEDLDAIYEEIIQS